MKSFRLYRMFIIVTMAVRFFLQWYLFQQKWQAGQINEMQTAWEQLLAAQAREFRRRALQLEGLMIKVGQFLSTRVDVLPKPFTNELKDLVDRVPPAPVDAIRDLLRKEWHVPLEQVFHHFSEAPVASASIADVYKATMQDGRSVAVKVRRPNVHKLIRADYAALRVVIWLARTFSKWGKWLDLKALYKDFVATTNRELDFREELRHAERFTALIRKHQLNITTPDYDHTFSTEKVLVMEWMDGAQVTDNAWIERHQIDRQKLIREMIDLFFAQIFEEGFFHADPHPGNLLLAADGTLQVIDFGMMGTIRTDTKNDFRLFLQGFIQSDTSKMAKAFEGLGFLRTGAEPLDLQALIGKGMNFFLNKDFSRVDEQTMVELLQFLREYIANNPLQLPAEFSFLGRAVNIMSGVLASIDPQIDYLEAVKPAVDKWLSDERDETAAEQEQPFAWLGIFQRRVTPWFRTVLGLPQRMTSFFEEQPKAEYFGKQQWFALLLFIFLLSAGITLYLFGHWPLAALFAGASIWQYIEYRKFRIAWYQTTSQLTNIKGADKQ